MSKSINETLAFCKRIESEWSRDVLPMEMLEDMGCNMHHVRTLARYGHIRVSF